MFKSARYYFNKKTENETPKKRRVYIPSSSDFLNTIDVYINSIQEDCQPNLAFNKFCENNIPVVNSEIERLIGLGIDKDEISLKIKKTFKNRYFIAKKV